MSVARARINRNTAAIFVNMPENIATENNLSDTPGNIFNTDEVEYNQITNLTV